MKMLALTRMHSVIFNECGQRSALGSHLLALSFLFLAAVAPSYGVSARDLDISSVPPYFAPSVEPNLIVSVEHSGTMHSGRLPWNLPTDEYFRKTPMATAAEVNTLYYNPQIVYLPPVDANGNQMVDGVFTEAKRSAFVAGQDDSCSLDLSRDYEFVLIEEEPQVCDELTRSDDPSRLHSVYAQNIRHDDYAVNVDPNVWPYSCLYGGVICPAYYNVFRAELCPEKDLEDLNVAEWARQWTIDAATDPDAALDAYQARLDEWSVCFETVDVGSDTERNFANWYVYHRTVGRSVKTALSRAMAGLGSNVRVTYQSVSEAYPSGASDLNAKLTPFSGTGRTAYYDWLFALNPDSEADALPVSAMFNAGEFARTLSAYLEDPDDSDGAHYYCRNNLHLLLAASPWVEWIGTGGAADAVCSNVAVPDLSLGDDDWLGNNDGTAITLGDDATSYDARPPYGDLNTGMLADLAFYYWATDLIDAPDDVTALIADASGTDEEDYWNPANDPAVWQHLTTFTVGMDLRGSVSYDSGDYGAGSNVASQGFPGSIDAIGQCSADWDPGYPELNLDDIWHAGVNGRGGYTNATNATDLLANLTAVTERVAAAAGSTSTSSEAISTGVLFSGDMVYQTVMSPLDWSGDLRIIQISHGLGQPPCETKPLGELCQDVAAGQDPYRSAAKELAEQDWTGSGETGRDVLTRNDTEEFAFRSDNWDLLSEDQRDALMSGGVTETEAQKRIDFLRGDRSNEAGQGGMYSFRERGGLIGDILRSTPPVVVGAPYRFYQDHGYLTEVVDGDRVVGFRETHANRTEVVYVGANDGMLHAFDANLGTELFAYVPKMVFDGLADLTMSGYGSDPSHRNFVDGQMVEGDAYFGGAWHTVLAVSAGLGAQGLFALDVTSPDNVAEPTGSVELDSTAALSLWELTDADDPDIGYILGRPSIVRICPNCADDLVGNSRWVVVFGNGYNSAQDDDSRPAECELALEAAAAVQAAENEETAARLAGDLAAAAEAAARAADARDAEAALLLLCGQAVLFVTDIDDPGETIRFETSSLGGGGPGNGLAQPTVVDYDGDLVADAAYAGDLSGHLWRFDLTDMSSTPTRLFTARVGDDLSDAVQPITTPPAVLRHPLGTGVLVIFGTGKLLEAADISDTQVQTIYAIWDDLNETPVGSRADLRRQYILPSQSVAAVTTVSNARVVSNEPIDWTTHKGWYLDLFTIGVSTAADGSVVLDTNPDPSTVKERILGAPELDFNRLIFSTLTPTDNRCTAGGSSWVNIIDARNGSRLEAATFDLDLDGGIGTSDLVTVPNADGAVQVSASSMQLVTAGSEARGIYTSPASLAVEAGKEIKGLTTGEGSPTADETFEKWRVWRKIR